MEQLGLQRNLFSTSATIDERQVRRLLASARRADPLRGDPFAEELLRVTHSANIGEGLRKLVDLTFRDLGYMGSRLSELIHRSDLDAALPFTAVASEMGLSLRQFFRYRARAVSMLAAQLRALLQQPNERTETLVGLFDTLVNSDPQGALALYPAGAALPAIRAFTETAESIPAAIFEQAQRECAPLAFALRAQQRYLFGERSGADEDVARAESGMHAVADASLRRNVHREILHARALLARALGKTDQLQKLAFQLCSSVESEPTLRDSILYLESLVREGELLHCDAEIERHMAAAQQQHDVIAAVQLCLLAGVCAAYNGELTRAKKLAVAARIAGQHHVWLSTLALIFEKRIDLALGDDVQGDHADARLPADSWHAVMADSVAARQLLAQRRIMECANRVNRNCAVATRLGYDGLLAYNESTLAAIDGLEGRVSQERERYRRVWNWHAKSRDFILGLDLLTPPNATWREIGVLEKTDLGIALEALDSKQTRYAISVLVPLAERHAWIADTK